MSRLDDADAVFDARAMIEGVPYERATGISSDVDRIYHTIGDEGFAATKALVLDAVDQGEPFDPSELFGKGVLVGLAAAHRAGLGWAEAVLVAKNLPAINLGIVRASAERIVAGGHE